tara:strand:+ start:632 stop:1615 length:984 start_codon:yes stop_codon:yes gene_type:complete
MCDISELYEHEEDKLQEKENTVVVIDGHNIAYRCLYSDIYRNPDDAEHFYIWRYLFMNNVFNVIKQYSPDKLILVFDEKSSWRYDEYPLYKAQRKKNKQKLGIDWENFFDIFENFIEDIKKTFTNMYVLKLPRTEGDDIIGVLTMNNLKTDKVIIVSNDGDMHQLLENRNVNQHDPKTSEFIECLNPSMELEMKILQGDNSDNIFGVHKGIGPVTAQKIAKMGFEEYVESVKVPFTKEFKEGKTKEELNKYIVEYRNTIRDNYELNRKLIDMRYIPEYIKTPIINTYTAYETTPIDGKDVINFFKRNKLLKHLAEWNIVSKHFKKLS